MSCRKTGGIDGLLDDGYKITIQYLAAETAVVMTLQHVFHPHDMDKLQD